MKPTLIFVSVCVATFFVTLFFVMQTDAQASPMLYLPQTPSQQANGVVLPASASPSVSGVSNSDIQNGPLKDLRTIPHTGTFLSLLEEMQVPTQLSTTGRYTLFIPTDEAFALSSVGPLAYRSAEEKQRLVQYHVVPGEMISVDSLKFGHSTMLSRDELNVSVFDVPTIGANSRVVGTYRVGNGIVYVIDIVLLPPELRPFPF